MKKNIIIILIAIGLGLGAWFVYQNINHFTMSGDEPNQISATKILNYSHHNLISVGPEIYKQIDTTQLILSYNNIKTLPSQMGDMVRLQVLKVDHNFLQGSLIAEIRKMPLITLDASYNNMTGVPAEIGQLSNLQTLDLSYNQIDNFPNEIAQIKQLKILNVTGNPLTADKITQLKVVLPNTKIVY